MPTKDLSSDWFSIDSVFVAYQMPWADQVLLGGTFTLAVYDPDHPPPTISNADLGSATINISGVSVTSGTLVVGTTAVVATNTISPATVVPATVTSRSA